MSVDGPAVDLLPQERASSPGVSTVVIVGAGEAGVAACAAMRASGYSGKIVLIGEESHAPYARPPLSKDMLLGTCDTPQPIQVSDFFSTQNIDARWGWRATEIDTRAQRVRVEGNGGQQWLAYDRLLLATGSSARRLTYPQSDDLCYLRCFSDASKLRQKLSSARSLAVVGGGVIGLEVASAARKLGLGVTVIELGGRVMGRMAVPAVASKIQRLHEKHGVRILTNVQIAGTRRGSHPVLELSDKTQVPADVIFAGVGAVPNDELGRAAGCAADNGIKVDSFGQTSIENIFAADDVASVWHPIFHAFHRIESWQHARRHGAHVGRSMVGDSAEYVEIPWFWTDQHGVNIQVAGFPTQANRTVKRGSAERCTYFHLQEGKLVGATAFDNGRDMRPAIQLIAKGAALDPDELIDPAVPLRTLLAGSSIMQAA